MHSFIIVITRSLKQRIKHIGHVHKGGAQLVRLRLGLCVEVAPIVDALGAGAPLRDAEATNGEVDTLHALA